MSVSAPIMDRLSADLDRCNGCGFCQAACPVYKTTGIEWTVARGRVALLRATLEGRLPMDDSIREPLFNCLTCGACVEHCPPGVPTDKIVTKAREEVVRRQGEHWVQRLLFQNVLPNPLMLGLSVRLLWVAQVSGAESLVRTSGVLNTLGELGKAAGILPRLRGRSGRATAEAAKRDLDRPKYRVAYFLGCGTNNLFPNAAGATVRVLQRQGVEVLLPEVVCCGKPPISYGDAESARKLARHNVDQLLALDVDAVVTDCATCGSFLREYGELLADDPEYAERAAKLSAKMQDVLAFLGEIGVAEEMVRVPARVTYHDPCHLGRFQKVTKAPRDLLRTVPGVDFAEMAEANMCCGGAGSYSLTHHEISMKVLDRKMNNVSLTQAEVLATACPGCAMQLSYGLKQHGIPARVAHVVEILDQAYERCSG
ncbi:MAG: (Fe-S)-binding protein [Dehalococcoidales bacterium]|nr:(Fe-S)-binding protein [Dehalococcoidales bacterium]